MHFGLHLTESIVKRLSSRETAGRILVDEVEGLGGVGQRGQSAAELANIGGFNQPVPRQFALDSEREMHLVRRLVVRVEVVEYALAKSAVEEANRESVRIQIGGKRRTRRGAAWRWRLRCRQPCAYVRRVAWGRALETRVSGEIAEPSSALGEHINENWEELVGPANRSLVHWIRRLVFRGAWLDQRVKEGELDVIFDEESQAFGYVQPDRSSELIELSKEPSWRRIAYRR